MDQPLHLQSGDSIDINFSEPIRSFYLVWDAPPKQWDLIAKKDDKEFQYTYGKKGFFHDYIDIYDLWEDYDQIMIVVDGDAILREFRAGFTGDTFPDDPTELQMWQPPLEKADVLVFPARAGDEFLYFGGTIPYYLAQGKSVQVAYMTNLYSEPEKMHQLLNGLCSAGIRNYPVISDFPEVTVSSVEGALEHYDDDALISFATEQLRRFKPEVVVGPGEYGDGVQMLSSNALMIAAELSGDALEYHESAREYGEWSVPKVYLHGYKENEISMPWDSDSLGIAEQALSRYSWRKNRSIATTGAYDCRKFGLFRTTVGDDTEKDDFFENIKNYVETEVVSEPEPEQAEKSEPSVSEQDEASGLFKSEFKPELSEVMQALKLPQLFGKIDPASLIASPFGMMSVAVLMIVTAILLGRKQD